ncbi:MAG: SUMF1/EgtB/PvdO family nonheme iron enzyme, partial [Cyanobacteria bacterium REEB444]|nr:SUMF1/EgtB/PvdO family nonheme iron enzyme [Cyanobacteria bacterium REEB444]
MSYCLNPHCRKPNQNKSSDKFCQTCGTPLLLQNRYRAQQPIGQGGFGVTYRAVDEAKPSHPQCVIKQFNPQGQGNIPKAIELFHQEAIRLEQLGHHDQIPALHAHFEQDNRLYIVQDYIAGITLAQELAQQGVFNEHQIHHLLTDILPVLDFIHQGQVIHRDIKPENIIRKADGHLVLVDFGAAKYATGTTLARTGTVIGSAEYTAPEQGRGRATFASDLYGLGVTCLHLLTQISPFVLYSDLESGWIWRQYMGNRQVSEGLGRVIDRLVVHGLKERYQTAREVMDDLVLKPQTGLSPSSSMTPSSSKPKQVLQPSPSGSSLTLEPYQYRSVRVDGKGNVTPYSANSPGGKYVEKGLKLPSGALPLEMVVIPAGTFTMGSPDNEAGRFENEGPQRQVRVKQFLMGRYAVTQAQYEGVMGTNPSRFKGNNRPVEGVSWDNAQEFIRRLNEKTGKRYRLPTEAEWEYGARAGTTTPFSYGATITPEVANYDGNNPYGNAPKGEFRKKTMDVNSLYPNPWGLYHIHGNVWEWVEDYWHDNYEGAPTDGSAWLTGG